MYSPPHIMTRQLAGWRMHKLTTAVVVSFTKLCRCQVVQLVRCRHRLAAAHAGHGSYPPHLCTQCNAPPLLLHRAKHSVHPGVCVCHAPRVRANMCILRCTDIQLLRCSCHLCTLLLAYVISRPVEFPCLSPFSGCQLCMDCMMQRFHMRPHHAG